jgi:predicted O-methyltransferase YrrM
MKDLLLEMEVYAELNSVPIMQKEGIEFMCNFIRENNIKSVLEIGSAIGYSAIQMALVNEDIHVTTIERDEPRYLEAVKNVKAANLENRIELIFGDALETVVDGSYDLLFIDAAKAQYIRFFDRYTPFLQTNGYVITDNLDFHGLVANPEKTKNKNTKDLVRKISRFRQYLTERTDYDTTFYTFGDGVAISKKR